MAHVAGAQAGVQPRGVGELRNDRDAQPGAHVGLHHVGVQCLHREVDRDTGVMELALDARPLQPRGVLHDDREPRQFLQREPLHAQHRMARGRHHDMAGREHRDRHQLGRHAGRQAGHPYAGLALQQQVAHAFGRALQQLELHLRMPAGEGLDGRQQHIAGMGVRGGQHDGPALLAACLLADGADVVGALQRAARPDQGGLPHFREPDDARAAPNQQIHAQRLLDLPQLLAYRRLRGMQVVGRARDVELRVHQGAQALHLAQLDWMGRHGVRRRMGIRLAPSGGAAQRFARLLQQVLCACPWYIRGFAPEAIAEFRPCGRPVRSAYRVLRLTRPAADASSAHFRYASCIAGADDKGTPALAWSFFTHSQGDPTHGHPVAVLWQQQA